LLIFIEKQKSKDRVSTLSEGFVFHQQKLIYLFIKWSRYNKRKS